MNIKKILFFFLLVCIASKIHTSGDVQYAMKPLVLERLAGARHPDPERPGWGHSWSEYEQNCRLAQATRQKFKENIKRILKRICTAPGSKENGNCKCVCDRYHKKKWFYLNPQNNRGVVVYSSERTAQLKKYSTPREQTVSASAAAAAVPTSSTSEQAKKEQLS